MKLTDFNELHKQWNNSAIFIVLPVPNYMMWLDIVTKSWSLHENTLCFNKLSHCWRERCLAVLTPNDAYAFKAKYGPILYWPCILPGGSHVFMVVKKHFCLEWSYGICSVSQRCLSCIPLSISVFFYKSPIADLLIVYSTVVPVALTQQPFHIICSWSCCRQIVCTANWSHCLPLLHWSSDV